MKARVLSYIIIFILVRTVSQAKEHGLSAEIDTIPFERTVYNNLIMHAVLNGADTVRLMFHTASNDITLVEKSATKLKSIRFEETVEGVKSWGGESNDSRMSLNNRVDVAGLSWSGMPIWEDVNSGQGADGKFGLGLLRNKVVALNFDSCYMVVSDDLPPDIARYEKLPLLIENGNLFVSMQCSDGDLQWNNRFLIHSGYAGALMFDDEFVMEHRLDSVLRPIGEKVLHDAFGNAIVSKKVVVPSIKLGQQELTNVAAGYFKGAAGLQRISILGGDILKRFNLVIDADRSFLYLKKSHLFSAEFTSL